MRGEEQLFLYCCSLNVLIYIYIISLVVQQLASFLLQYDVKFNVCCRRLVLEQMVGTLLRSANKNKNQIAKLPKQKQPKLRQQSAEENTKKST